MEVYWYVIYIILVDPLLTLLLGNYDITKMHYDGPGIPGGPAGYGYDQRTLGLSSADVQVPVPVAATA